MFRLAQEQAAEITSQARQDADRRLAAAQNEADRLRARAATDLAALTDDRRARFRRPPPAGAGRSGGRLRTSSPRAGAAAGRGPDRGRGRTSRRNAGSRALRGLGRVGGRSSCAPRPSASRPQPPRELADRRDRQLSELRARQEAADTAIRERLADAALQQSTRPNTSSEQTAEAAGIRAAALAEAEQLEREALEDADALVQRAQHHAATIEERARQEFAWRKRQMRREAGPGQPAEAAVLEHLVSLSALATETVENLPEVREFEPSDPAGDKASLSS